MSSHFPFKYTGNSTFRQNFGRFSTGQPPARGEFLRRFPHAVKTGKILLQNNTFFCVLVFVRNLSTDFSTPCGKLFSHALLVCRTFLHESGQATTFQRQINDIYQFSFCHTDKMLFEIENFSDFFLKFTTFPYFFSLSAEFSTECGKTCGKSFSTNFEKSLTGLENWNSCNFYTRLED